MDPLFQAAGVGLDAKQEQQLQPLLVETALTFLRCGGRLSLLDFALLSGPSRAAFAAAGDMFRAATAAQIGAAASGPEGAANVLAEVDGGQAKADLAVSRVADKAAARLAGKGGKA